MGNRINHTRLFHVKPFSLSHHKSSMRVGTDAMLLGLFIDASNCINALEIGTGSGIISLLIASSHKTTIDAIDIDSESVRETEINFKKSPFHYRLKAIEADFKDFAISYSGNYDIIFSNPPFFINDFRPEDELRKVARHTDSLSYKQICEGSIKLLQPSGKLYLVLPFDESRVFLELAKDSGLKLQRQQLVIPKRSLAPNRINMQLGFEEASQIVTEKFIIREDDGNFTNQYIEYLKDYYIGLK